MQRPCERENRAGTSIETRANVSMRRNIAHITSNRNDLRKKKKRKSNSTRGLRLAKIRSLSRAKSIAPWNFEAGACMSVSACQRVARALPPPLGGFERVCWLYARDLRVYVYEVTLPAFFPGLACFSVCPFAAVHFPLPREERRGELSEWRSGLVDGGLRCAAGAASSPLEETLRNRV